MRVKNGVFFHHVWAGIMRLCPVSVKELLVEGFKVLGTGEAFGNKIESRNSTNSSCTVSSSKVSSNFYTSKMTTSFLFPPKNTLRSESTSLIGRKACQW